ncbi:non-homologous end-joining DNA ligase [Arenibaculum pallidiluteum]|uniref:non-homologous end-joining DNA ligase n=1 Tax=Arenibaculum pallidiluteum TaxID=2812559 RepID=UPI001A96B6F4|nr:non-homologous end-joining DNA ligase [Arenibaculum pallidiluteum]
MTSKTAETGSVEIAGVALTHPDRPVWPGQGVTKAELARHFERVAARMLPHVAGRPLTLVRCPRGNGRRCFVQRNVGPGFGKAIRRVPVLATETTVLVPVVEDLAGLVSLVQVGVLEIHPWGALADDPGHADRLVFDLDPGEGIDWRSIAAAARDVAGRIEAAGLAPFLKTSGGKGLHVVVPLAPRQPWERAAAVAGRIAEELAGDAPDRFTTALAKTERAGRIFVDVLRNRRGASAVAPYSPRARSGAPVSTPLAWDDLPYIEGPGELSIATLPGRLGGPDPWAGFFEAGRPLPSANA